MPTNLELLSALKKRLAWLKNEISYEKKTKKEILPQKLTYMWSLWWQLTIKRPKQPCCCDFKIIEATTMEFAIKQVHDKIHSLNQRNHNSIVAMVPHNMRQK